MARASFIYVVEDRSPCRRYVSRVVAAFTVKHEFMTWWSLNKRRRYDVFRLRDGGREVVTPTFIPTKERS
jgi:hypothetical protein